MKSPLTICLSDPGDDDIDRDENGADWIDENRARIELPSVGK